MGLAKPMPDLMIRYPDGRQVTFPLEKREVFVGRDASCDITLQDGITSRRHARIFSDGDGRFWVEDLKSKNGISLNDQPVASALIRPGDRIGIGTCQLVLMGPPQPTVAIQDALLATQTAATSAWGADERLDLPRKRLETLYELNERLTGRFDRDDLLRELLDVCVEQLRFERVGVAVWDGPGHAPEWIHLRNIGADSNGEFRISRSVVERTLHQGERVLIVDTGTGEIDPTASMVSNNIRSAMCVPMEYLQEVRGVLYGDRVTSSARYGREDIDFFAALGRLGAMGLANVRLVEELQNRRQVELQLQLAREIQTDLFPARPLEDGDVSIHALNDPGQKVSGDYFDYFRREDGKIAVIIADVAGKGVSAALLMANMQAAVRVLLASESDLIKTVGVLNRLFCDNMADGRFITAIVGLLDPEERRFEYVNAGHLVPYLIRGDATLEKIENEPNLILGVLNEANYDVQRLDLPDRPSRLLLYTDGVPEAGNEAGEQFQDERFASALASCLALPPSELVIRIRRSIKQFTRQHPQSDDITLLAVELR